MIEQRFTISSIERSKVGDSTFAAATLVPVQSSPATSSTPAMPVPGVYISAPQTLRVTGLPASEATDWSVDDTIVLSFTKQGS